MTEQEYIDTKALTVVRHVQEMLRDVIPESTTFVSQEDFVVITTILCAWETSGYELIQLENVPGVASQGNE